MNAVQTKIVENHKRVIANKPTPIYSQDGAKRECTLLAPYKDGKYYGDCSSSVRQCTENADPTTKPLGSNTVVQYQNKRGVIVNCGIVNGVPTVIGALQVGDCFYWAGTDSSRAAADYVGHVAQVHSIESGKVMLFDFGTNPPKYNEMVAYCKARQAARTSTKKGNKGLLKVVRFIDIGGAVATPPPETSLPDIDMLGARILKYSAKGEDVKQLQRALRTLGFFGGSIGGNYLDITRNAVKAFQKKHKLTQDGQFGPLSLAMLKQMLPPIEPNIPTAPNAKVYTTTGNVFMRKGPGTQYEDKGVAAKGTKLTAEMADGKPIIANGFCAVVVNGGALWVSAKYIQ